MSRILSLAFVAALCISANSEEPNKVRPRYAIVDHMQLVEGVSAEDYIEFEELHQRIFQDRVDGGVMRAWHMGKVENNDQAQFATMRIFDSLSQYEQRLPRKDRKVTFTPEEQEKVRSRAQIRRMMSSELWRIQSMAMLRDKPETTDGNDAHYVRIDYIKATPGKRWDYVKMEEKLFQRIHQARIDAGEMTAWMFFSREFPGGDDSEWDFATINAYPNAEAARKRSSVSIRDVLTKEEMETFPKVGSLRKVVRYELWHPLLRTKPTDRKQ